MANAEWAKFKLLFSDLFKVDSRMADLIAVQEILLFCVSGRSVRSISLYLNVSEEYVREVLYEFLKFQGFEYDLDLSPISVFKRHKDFDSFVIEIQTLSPVTIDKEFIIWYNICNKYDSIREEIAKFYGTD